VAVKYSLEQVLDLKKQMENQRKLQLAQAEKARQEQVERLDALFHTLEVQLETKLTPDMIEQRGQFFSSHLARIENAREELRRAVDHRDLTQAHLVQAALDRKKFEVHKENVLAAVRQTEQIIEQNQLDESATQCYLRQVR